MRKVLGIIQKTSISNGFTEQGGGGASAGQGGASVSAEVDCDGSDSSGTAPEVAASDDDDGGDDGGDDDGEPARKTSKASKNSILKVGANLRLSIQPLTSNDAGNNMTSANSGKHRNVTATADDLLVPQNSSLALWRLPMVLAHIPVSRSGWWAGVKTGRYPQPVKLSTRCVAWRSQDIAALIASF